MKLLITEKEKKTIKELYGIVNEQGVDKLLNVLSTDDPAWLKGLIDKPDLRKYERTKPPAFIDYLEKTTGKSFDEIDKNELIKDIYDLRYRTFKTHDRLSDFSKNIVNQTQTIESIVNSNILPMECESWFKNLFYMSDEEFNSLDSEKYMKDNNFTKENFKKQLDLLNHRFFGRFFEVKDKFLGKPNLFK